MTEHDHEGEFEQGVMVDVGHGRGALVIYAPDELRGQEIEISPVGLNSQRVHASVLRRRMTNGQVSAVVFGSVPPGDYRLWHASHPETVTVTIEEGRVTELDWR
jgi:hypothetical protein